jgi:mannose-6-phosphate isomerase
MSQKSDLTPLFFQPVLVDKPWGGTKLKKELGKRSCSNTCGESWEISGIKGAETTVENGKFAGKTITALSGEFKERFLGKKIYAKFGDNFPLLLKFIDANETLSVQVHPDDAMAQRVHGENGKSEMWYVVQADEEAVVWNGFKKGVDEKKCKEALYNNTILSLLNTYKAKKGDVFNIPAGRVHAIGKGCLIAEIQQSSDRTYRVYDFDRVDEKGKSRELHRDLAFEAFDFTSQADASATYQELINGTASLVESPFFEVNKISGQKEIKRDISNKDSFVVYMSVEGSAEISVTDVSDTYFLQKGKTLFVPAKCAKIVSIRPSAEHTTLLEVCAKA